jgi:Ca2+-binding EF-hand superfamily protein
VAQFASNNGRAASATAAEENDSPSTAAAWEAILKVIHRDPEAFIRNIDVVYRTFDQDGDGVLDCLELAEGLSSLGVAANITEVAGLLQSMDADGDGTISADEFEAAVQERSVGFAEAVAWARVLTLVDKDPMAFATSVETIYTAFDTDGNGDIDISELSQGLLSLGIRMNDGQLEAFRATLDLDGDGNVSVSTVLLFWGGHTSFFANNSRSHHSPHSFAS